jgi:hypothetical protein
MGSVYGGGIGGNGVSIGYRRGGAKASENESWRLWRNGAKARRRSEDLRWRAASAVMSAGGGVMYRSAFGMRIATMAAAMAKMKAKHQRK